MKAIDEVKRLQAKIDSGEMSQYEPLFVLRAQDRLCVGLVRMWCILAEIIGTPREKCEEARMLSAQAESWPVKQVPGRPDTRVDFRTHDAG